MAKLLKGKDIAVSIQNELKKEISVLGSRPKVVAVSANDDPASDLYLKSQKRLAQELGIKHELLALGSKASVEELMMRIEQLNNDTAVHGIIIQMPLPEHIHLGKVLETLDPKKDVEGLTADNLGLLVLKKGKLVPCTALAAMALIEATDVKLYGAEAVVVGASKIVGSPVALMLAERMATTTICTIGTSDKGKLEEHVRRADILVVAVGKPGVIPGEWVKEGAVVIDVGINRIEGKTVGDVDFKAAEKRAGFITPVPGGVGPLTVTMLFKNTIEAFKMQQ